ncbi:MAG: 6,7-dimethyl-8-ribityllumazine synthase [Acidocella sp. 20-63-7]|nr:MAG: 6,7-dimethyl-8-ribityllumazine synthase [Acidocella sp. 20-63-7]
MSTADMPAPTAPKLPGAAPKILIVSAPYYHHVVDGMLSAAQEILRQVSAETTVVEVSGAYELPQGVAIALAGTQEFDGFIVLGCVVRGETDHYEFICGSTMDGLMRLATDRAICLGTAVLTVDTLAQAVARSHESGANKGAEAAVACLKQIALKRKFQG